MQALVFMQKDLLMHRPAHLPCRSACSGKTLLELAVTLFIVSLLLSLGSGSWSGLVRASRADATIYSLQRLVYRARSQAVSSGDIVSLCAYSPTGCGSRFEEGLMLFSDRNNNGKIGPRERQRARNTRQRLDRNNNGRVGPRERQRGRTIRSRRRGRK